MNNIDVVCMSTNFPRPPSLGYFCLSLVGAGGSFKSYAGAEERRNWVFFDFSIFRFFDCIFRFFDFSIVFSIFDFRLIDRLVDWFI